MTLIIGIKYKKGVILFGDTKVTKGRNSHHQDKIVKPIEELHIVVGCAGYTELAKDFNLKLKEFVSQRYSEYRLNNIRQLAGTGIDITDIESGKRKDVVLPYFYSAINLLEDCATLTAQIATMGKVYSQNPIESLVAILLGNGNAMLYEIDCNGFKVEVPYASVGSGTCYIEEYLKNNYYEDISLEEAILLGTFLIKYVEFLGFDEGVGLKKGQLPQMFLLNKSYVDEHKIEGTKKDEILKEVEERLNSIKKSLLLFEGKGERIDKPVWGESNKCL